MESGRHSGFQIKIDWSKKIIKQRSEVVGIRGKSEYRRSEGLGGPTERGRVTILMGD